MLGENEMKLLISIANDYIKTLQPSAAFCVAEQLKVAVGNLEAYLKMAAEATPKQEVESP